MFFDCISEYMYINFHIFTQSHGSKNVVGYSYLSDRFIFYLKIFHLEKGRGSVRAFSQDFYFIFFRFYYIYRNTRKMHMTMETELCL